QTVNFVFSPRGEFIRESLVDTIVASIDGLGRRALQQAVFSIREQVGLQPKVPVAPQSETLAHVMRILDILRETPGFNPELVIELIPHVLSQPEFRRMGRDVAGELSQRLVARAVRELLIQTDRPQPPLRPALPAAR
ncbi:MAG: AarF/ABC1/UbiB kinase family protein, partial [Cyanobacteria bacterium P01_A01_bin.135]